MGTKIYFTALFLLISINKLHAQCAMCKAAVEANLKDGGSAGAGLDEGILYLMTIPYIVIMLFGFFYFLQPRDKKQAA